MQIKFDNFIKKTGLNEIKLLLAVLSVAAGMLIFISIANEVAEGETQSFDNYILKSLREPGNVSQPAFPGWVTDAMKDITSLGSATVIILFTIIVAGLPVSAKKILLAVDCSYCNGWWSINGCRVKRIYRANKTDCGDTFA